MFEAKAAVGVINVPALSLGHKFPTDISLSANPSKKTLCQNDSLVLQNLIFQSTVLHFSNFIAIIHILKCILKQKKFHNPKNRVFVSISCLKST